MKPGSEFFFAGVCENYSAPAFTDSERGVKPRRSVILALLRGPFNGVRVIFAIKRAKKNSDPIKLQRYFREIYH